MRDPFSFLESKGWRITEDGDGPMLFMVKGPDDHRYYEMDVWAIEEEAERLGWVNPEKAEQKPDPVTEKLIADFLAPLYGPTASGGEGQQRDG